jgi:hypothetical protein
MNVEFDSSNSQVIEKKNKESIREYVQKWCETASQINPSLLKKNN